jgi:hypothetical protein
VLLATVVEMGGVEGDKSVDLSFRLEQGFH